MPEFISLFEKNDFKPIEYNGKTLVMSDQLPIINGDKLMVVFEKINSEWKQGIDFAINGYFEVNGQKIKREMIFWKHTAPKQAVFTAWDTLEKPKKWFEPLKGFMSIANVWDSGHGRTERWDNGAAMIVEEIENGRRYWCNDGHPDDNFDDIVFTIQKIGSVEES